jgi:hypothetical protein
MGRKLEERRHSQDKAHEYPSVEIVPRGSSNVHLTTYKGVSEV